MHAHMELRIDPRIQPPDDCRSGRRPNGLLMEDRKGGKKEGSLVVGHSRINVLSPNGSWSAPRMISVADPKYTAGRRQKAGRGGKKEAKLVLGGVGGVGVGVGLEYRAF